jgi:hypothetical protein
MVASGSLHPKVPPIVRGRPIFSSFPLSPHHFSSTCTSVRPFLTSSFPVGPFPRSSCMLCRMMTVRLAARECRAGGISKVKSFNPIMLGLNKATHKGAGPVRGGQKRPTQTLDQRASVPTVLRKRFCLPVALNTRHTRISSCPLVSLVRRCARSANQRLESG